MEGKTPIIRVIYSYMCQKGTTVHTIAIELARHPDQIRYLSVCNIYQFVGRVMTKPPAIQKHDPRTYKYQPGQHAFRWSLSLLYFRWLTWARLIFDFIIWAAAKKQETT